MVAEYALAPCELFVGLTPEELTQVAALVDEVSYEAGDVILAESEPARKLYILCSGRVQLQILLRSPDEPESKATLEEMESGRIFGWSSLVRQQRFTASARAQTPVRLFVIQAEDLNALFERNAHLGFVVMKQLAEVIASRLRHTREVCGNLGGGY